MNKEELHLGLSDPAAQTLAWSEAEAQAPEVVALGSEPARGTVLLRVREDPVITTHSVDTQLN